MIQKNVTEAQFDQVVSQGVWLAAFCTEHCGPCKMLHKELEQIISFHPDINLAECDVEKDRALGKRFKIFGTPTLLFYKDGVCTGRMVGVSRETLNERLSECLYGE